MSAALEHWVCLYCSLRVQARGATAVGHRCPSNRNRMTELTKDEVSGDEG